MEQGWDVVKRPTGGGKVYHLTDTCFSVMWSKNDPSLPWGLNESYCALHRWVQTSLKTLGIVSGLSDGNGRDDSEWCFKNPVRSDLVAGNKKIVGSAQLREGDFALHQGSIDLQLSDRDIPIFKQSFRQIFKVDFI